MADPHATGSCVAECAAYLRRRVPYEVTISTERPVIVTPYTYVDGALCAFRCPHGVVYYLEPTSEQIAQWAKEGTP